MSGCSECVPGCTCGFGGEHLDNNPRCAANNRVVTAEAAGAVPDDETFQQRCERAAVDLECMAAIATSHKERSRLLGKAEGVRLAVSYLNDYPRAALYSEDGTR